MVINRAGALAGSLAIVGGAFVMWPAGDPVRAQQPSVSGPSTVHSIKVTLAPSTPGGADCQLRDPLPQTAGVYPKDTVTFNLENGCGIEATISISDFKLVQPVKGTARLFDPIAKWPLDVTLGPRTASNARNRVDAVVSGEGWQDDQDEYAFEYSISLKGSGSGGTVEKPGTIRLCRRPPCT
ncbi:MAG TPA: hypothetical protein VFO14_25260 [Vicinamibacterales bacterium]|nr:hypothetical protein [Vicinamibacterales bacterium]